MSKNNREEWAKKRKDGKQRFAFRKAKRGVASVLVGASVLGVGAGVIHTNDGNTGTDVTLEAAEAGPQIVAFDYYLLEGSSYDPATNVNAFEVVEGELVDLTSDVTYTVSVPSADDGSFDVTYTVTGSDGQEASTTATVTTGVDYEGALQSLEDAAALLQSEVEVLGSAADDIQLEFDDIDAQIENVRVLHDEYVAAVNAQDSDVQALAEQADHLQSEITTIMQVLTHSLSDVATVAQDVEDNYAFLSDEISRLEEELNAYNTVIDERVAEIEANLSDKATQEEVAAVDARVSAFLAETEGVTDLLSEQLTTLNTLYDDVVSGSVARDDAMLEMIDLQNERIDVLKDTLAQSSGNYEEDIASLQEALEQKADPAEIEALEAQLEAVKEDSAVSSALLEEQLLAAEQQNALLNERINGYESIISELEKGMATLEDELSVLERILSDLDAEEIVVDEDSEVVIPEPEPEPEENPEETDDNQETPDENVDEVVIPVDNEDPVSEDDTTTPDETESDSSESDTEETTSQEDAAVEPSDADVQDDSRDLTGTDDAQRDPMDGEDNIIEDGSNPDGATEGEVADVEAPVASDDTADAAPEEGSSDSDTGASEEPDEASATDGGGVAEPAAAGSGDSGETSAEGEPVETLPQTGSGFGALAVAGVGSLTALGAGIVKFVRRKS